MMERKKEENMYTILTLCTVQLIKLLCALIIEVSEPISEATVSSLPFCTYQSFKGTKT